MHVNARLLDSEPFLWNKRPPYGVPWAKNDSWKFRTNLFRRNWVCGSATSLTFNGIHYSSQKTSTQGVYLGNLQYCAIHPLKSFRGLARLSPVLFTPHCRSKLYLKLGHVQVFQGVSWIMFAHFKHKLVQCPIFGHKPNWCWVSTPSTKQDPRQMQIIENIPGLVFTVSRISKKITIHNNPPWQHRFMSDLKYPSKKKKKKKKKLN